jgi:K+-transporting ATPase ATPase C chain
MKETLRPAIVSLAAFTVLCGFVYPLAMDGIAAAVFPHQATGSLIRDRDGRVVGSELVGQPFADPAYFWSRPTAEANYDASNSTGTNQGMSGFVDDKGHLGPNPALTKTAQDRIAALRAADPGDSGKPQPVPVDLVTSSSSGLDPHISPAAAYYQVGRVARQRRLPEPALQALVAEHVEQRTLGVLGEPRVNVLLLNRALDTQFGSPSRATGATVPTGTALR